MITHHTIGLVCCERPDRQRAVFMTKCAYRLDKTTDSFGSKQRVHRMGRSIGIPKRKCGIVRETFRRMDLAIRPTVGPIDIRKFGWGQE